MPRGRSLTQVKKMAKLSTVRSATGLMIGMVHRTLRAGSRDFASPYTAGRREVDFSTNSHTPIGRSALPRRLSVPVVHHRTLPRLLTLLFASDWGLVAERTLLAFPRERSEASAAKSVATDGQEHWTTSVRARMTSLHSFPYPKTLAVAGFAATNHQLWTRTPER